jgi:hypothetical protein
MNLKTSFARLILFVAVLSVSKTFAQQPGCYMIPDVDGYKRAYKVNSAAALSSKAFAKTYGDKYIDTAYYIDNSLKNIARKNNNWRLTDQLGVAAPYCGDIDTDEFMFLSPGAYNNLEADRFFGKKGILGLGVLGGYTYYKVDQDKYKSKYNNYWAPLSGLNSSNINILDSKNYQHFYLMFGPALTFKLAKKLGLDLTFKAGPSFNSVARVGAENRLTKEVVQRIQPTSDRWDLGGNAGIRLMYQVADRWRVGANANAFYANMGGATEYESINPISSGSTYKLQSILDDRRQSNFNGGIAIQHIFPTATKHIYTPLVKLDPPTASPIAVAPSTVSPCNEIFTENKFGNSFTWKSNDSQSDKANETFTFKLYKVPGTQPILVKTVKEPFLALEQGLPVPADVCGTDEYYYTVQSNKGASFSEMVTCSFKIKNAAAASAKCGDISNMVSKAEAVPAASANVFLTRILGNESYTRQIIKYDEGKGCKCPIDTLTKKGTKLVEYFREYTNASELSTWPDGLPIPRKASGFIYEVKEVYAGEDEKTAKTKRYRMDVDRRTRAVTLRPIK